MKVKLAEWVVLRDSIRSEMNGVGSYLVSLSRGTKSGCLHLSRPLLVVA